MNNLAVLYKVQNRFEEARPLFKRALSVFTRALGPEHPHVLSCRQNLERLREAEEKKGHA